MQSGNSDRSRKSDSTDPKATELKSTTRQQSHDPSDDAAARKREYDATEPLDLEDPEDEYED